MKKQSVEQTAESDPSYRLSVVRSTDCDFDFGVIPPINRWAIVSRPLRGLPETQDLRLWTLDSNATMPADASLPDSSLS
jgi:hypothetical protein